MKDNVLSFLEETWGKRLRLHFSDGGEIDCVFYGYSYDYDDSDNEILEIDFECLDTGLLIGTTPDELDRIELL